MADKIEIKIQDFLSKTKEIVSRLEALGLDQFNRRIESLTGNIESFSKRTVKSGLVGITSSGKSSLLNVLLGTGKKILKEQSKATTNMIVFCSKSEKPELELHFDGREPVKKSGDKVLSESIWQYTSEDENPQNKFSVKFIKLALPTFLLDDDIELADTPGLDAYGLKEHEDLTLREFLPQADLIIYLSSVRSPMKEADRKILNKIMDADQRIIFVQTCKGAVVEGNYGEDSTESVSELLEKYKNELAMSIKPYARLKNSPIVQVETMQAIKFFKNKDQNAWQESGLDEFVHTIKGETKHLQDEFGLRNLRKTVGEVNALNTLILNTIEEEGGKEASIDEQTHQINILNEQYEQIVQDKEKVVAQLKKKLNSSAIYKKYKLELSRTFGNRYDFNPLHDKEFITKAQAISTKTQAIKKEFLNELDGAKERYRQCFDELGLDVRRTDLQQINKSSFYLPNVQKKRVSDAVGSKGSTGFLSRKQTGKITGEYIDKKKFIEELASSMQQFFEPLKNHLEWWEQTITYSYIEPLQKKIESLKDDIVNVEKGSSFDDTEYKELTGITGEIERILKNVSDLCDMDISTRKISRYVRTEKSRSEFSGNSDYRNIIVQLGNRLFEGMFHDYYIKCLSQMSGSGEKTIAVIGDNHEAVSNFLRRLIRTNDDSAGILQKAEMPFSVNVKSGNSGIRNITIKGELSDRLSFYVLGNDDKSYNAAEADSIFEKVDVIQVMVNDLHRVASALSDVAERNLFFEIMNKYRSKLLMTYPGGAHFQKERLHIMVDEAVAEINNLFAPDPVRWFIYENFEVRYSYFNDLAWKMVLNNLKPEECLGEWKTLGIPLDEPFSELTLKEQLEELAFQG